MTIRRWSLGRKVGLGVAATVLVLLAAGAARQGLSASAPAAGPEAGAQAAAGTPPVARAVGPARDSYADIVKVVAPTVVTIRTEGRTRASATQFRTPNDEFFRRFFGEPDDRFDGPRGPRTFRQRGLGSGVAVSRDGYILTNQHVVDGADTIRVELVDGRSLTATLVGSDRPSDLALLKVDAADLQAVAFGNSDAVQVGDVVLAVGNPLGVGQTVTMGIISAKGRSTSTRGGNVGYEDFLQTDAPINQGNSGGALVNMRGELIGINSQILSQSGGNIGIGFAIPVNMAKHVMDDLRTRGRVTRSQLGVTVQPVTSDMAASLGLKEVGGAIIGSVTPGTAADRAGLKRGDIILAFDGQPVADTNSLRNRVAEKAPGSTAEVTILRDGNRRQVSVRLEEAATERTARDTDASSTTDRSALGVSVAPLTPELVSRYGLPPGARGVVVQDVDPDGRAADAGIQAGDVIDEVNRQPVRTVDELRAAVRRSTDRPLLLLVHRDGDSIFMTVRPPRSGSS